MHKLPIQAPKILIVEDEAIVALDISTKLASLGYEIVGTVASGENAIESASNLNPDLILMDLRLAGDLDGIEAADIINQSLDIPFIFLTAYIDKETVERVKNIESHSFLVKPFDAIVIQTNIELALKQHQKSSKAKQREKRLALLTQNSFDMIAQIDKEGVISSFTNPVQRILRREPESLLGLPFTKLIHEDDRAAFLTAFKNKGADKNQAPIILTCRIQHGNGTWRFVEMIMTNMLDEPIISSFVLNIRDVTERKEEQDRLLQAQKIEAVGRLAGGIAHDFNNILTVIDSYASLLMGQMEVADKGHHYARQINNAAQKASLLAKRLLVFTQQNINQHDPLNLNQLISGLVPLIKRLLPKDTHFVLELSDEPIWINANEGQIDQLIFSMVTNAAEAMNPNGRFHIKTETTVFPSAQTSSYCLLTIEDDGIGIEPTVQNQIFEPFFSTKSGRQSAGLGLSIVHAIVSQHGGQISVKSQLGQGTAFHIFLPLHKRMQSLALSDSLPAFAGKQAVPHTILLVEDDPMVRELMSHILQESGYHLLIAENSQEAIEICQTDGLVIDVLVTDIVMPGDMNGRLLAEELQKRYPKMATLIVSGYANNSMQDKVLLNQYRFLAKPFTPEKLLEEIQELLRDSVSG